jgi:hypothetical protein
MAPDHQQYEPQHRLSTNPVHLICCPTEEWKERLKEACEKMGYSFEKVVKDLERLRDAAESFSVTKEELVSRMNEARLICQSAPKVRKGIPWNPRKSKRRR